MTRFFHIAALLVLMTACAEIPKDKAQTKLVLKPAAFADMPGWKNDQALPALQAFAKSCARILKAAPDKDFGPQNWAGKMSDWQAVCGVMPEPSTATESTARAFFESNFTPVAATDNGNAEGLFTGYYEASLNGSPVRTEQYAIPLRRTPGDLVQVDLGEFRTELKGQRIAGRVVDGKLKPYEDRAAIIAGALPLEKDLPIVWVDDAVDAFFLQIQGSGIVSMTDGTKLRVGYDAQNGHVYYAIGKELVKRGALKQEDVSMQSIRQWLHENPTQAAEVMNTNKSYVFFRALEGEGPLGGEGIALTPGRSLAIDRGLIPYGMPVFLAAAHPNPQAAPLQRLMVAQDTGGAIKGAVRGDFFWGFGPDAESNAGLMKSPGRYWFLLPKALPIQQQ